MNYAISAVAMKNLHNKIISLEIEYEKLRKVTSDLRQGFTIEYEEENNE